MLLHTLMSLWKQKSPDSLVNHSQKQRWGWGKIEQFQVHGLINTDREESVLFQTWCQRIEFSQCLTSLNCYSRTAQHKWRELCAAIHTSWVEGVRQTLSSDTIKIRDKRGEFYWFKGREKPSEFNTEKVYKILPILHVLASRGCWRTGSEWKVEDFVVS